MRTTLALATLVVLTTAAHADQVGVVVTGEATIQPQLAAQLEGWLHDHGRTVMPGALEPEAINTLIDCFVLEDLNCARKVVEARAKSGALVFARAEANATSDGSREVAITGYWLQKGHDAIAERRVCKKCNDQLLHVTVDDVMLALVHEPPPPALTSGPIKDSHGTDLEKPVDDAETKPLPTLPIALMAGGGLALVAGGVMIAIDQDPSPKGAQQAQYRDTATGGVILGVAGLAAAGAGVFLFITARTSSAPVAAISHDGAFIGWAGRF